MKLVQVVGLDCRKCAKLAKNAQVAVKEAGVEATIERITDVDRIISLDVIAMPGLIIDGDVKIVGRAASVDEIKKLLS